MLLITDVDGVLLDWHSSFIDWMRKKGCFLNYDVPHDTWDMTHWFYSLKDKSLGEWIKEFNASHTNLDPITDAFECLQDIQWQTGCTIIALSSFASTDDCYKTRESYLHDLSERITGENVFDNVIGLPLGTCKKDSLQTLLDEYGNAEVYFVEDNATHAESAYDLGITTFLIDTAYNKENTSATRVKDWNEIFTQIMNKKY